MLAAWSVAALLTLVPAAAAQEQQARASGAERPAVGEPVYDIVAADRETAWRINRMTGEIVVCRVDTTGSLDSARARCSPAAFETLPQQSRLPAAGATGGRP